MGTKACLPGQLQVWGLGTQREDGTIHWGQFTWDMLGQESRERPEVTEHNSLLDIVIVHRDVSTNWAQLPSAAEPCQGLGVCFCPAALLLTFSFHLSF